MATAWKPKAKSRVDYKWNEAGTLWYKGTVVYRRKNNIKVLFDDGDEKTVELKPGWFRQCKKPNDDDDEHALDSSYEEEDDEPTKTECEAPKPTKQVTKKKNTTKKGGKKKATRIMAPLQAS